MSSTHTHTHNDSAIVVGCLLIAFANVILSKLNNKPNRKSKPSSTFCWPPIDVIFLGQERRGFQEEKREREEESGGKSLAYVASIGLILICCSISGIHSISILLQSVKN